MLFLTLLYQLVNFKQLELIEECSYAELDRIDTTESCASVVIASRAMC